MMERLDRFSPPGMGAAGIRRWTIGAIVVSAFFSLIFLNNYLTELGELRRNMQYPVYAGVTMPYFRDLIVTPMAVFRLAPMVPLLFTPINYLYFYQESHSIYLMKRLKSNREIHIRCLVLPVIGAVLVIAAGCVVYGLYWLIYRYCTPEILLPLNL